MTDAQRIAYMKYLSRLLEQKIDSNGDFGCFYDNSYKNLIYSEYKTKRYLGWWWTPKMVYIPFQYEGEEIFIVTEDVIVKKLV